MMNFFEHLPYWIVIVALLIWLAIQHYTPAVTQVVNKITSAQSYVSTIDCKIHGFVFYSPNVNCTMDTKIKL